MIEQQTPIREKCNIYSLLPSIQCRHRNIYIYISSSCTSGSLSSGLGLNEVSELKGKVLSVLNWLSSMPWRRMVKRRYSSIVDLGARCTWVLSFISRPFQSRNSLDTRRGVHHSPSWCCGEEKESRWYCPWPIILLTELLYFDEQTITSNLSDIYFFNIQIIRRTLTFQKQQNLQTGFCDRRCIL
jgi:hypothetical protein